MDINQKNLIIRQNQETLSKISELEGKISGFGQTQAILDSAARGTGVWKAVLKDVSGFCGSKQNIWISKITRDNTNTSIKSKVIHYQNTLLPIWHIV